MLNLPAQPPTADDLDDIGAIGSAVPPENQLFSVGRLCAMFQLLPAELRRHVAAAGAQWSAVIDGVPLLNGHGVILLSRYLRRLRQQAEQHQQQ